jgi:site-specific DNA recombinase
MDRPALQRLLRDVESGCIDVIIVYKVDRLSRSLIDFARIVKVLDKHNVSFVSITQQFNTTTSMGRLTLNILLSFAQFEREVIGERIRDKFAASRRNGMWMGGTPPLGYNVVDRKLVVNGREAELVRLIFQRFLRLGSATRLAQELRRAGHTTKSWTTQDGKHRPGKPIDKGSIYKIRRIGFTSARRCTRGQAMPASMQRSSIKGRGTRSTPSSPRMRSLAPTARARRRRRC